MAVLLINVYRCPVEANSDYYSVIELNLKLIQFKNETYTGRQFHVKKAS